MALLTIKRRFELEKTCVLAPERYDPRRESLQGNDLVKRSLPLGDIVQIVRQTINPSVRTVGERRCVVLDTSDVREGIIIGRKSAIRIADLGSSKKVFLRNDVIISRLRPYLRQVAFVDEGFATACADAESACSSEFFVLRSINEEPIAFLVPYLLSAPVQSVLAASQEGGHHPRFDEAALANLPVPESLLAKREEVSAKVVKSAALYRQSEETMLELVGEATVAMMAGRSSRVPLPRISASASSDT